MATEDDVRRLALSLPETTERPWRSTPGFRVRDRSFARIRDDGLVVVFVADLDEKEALLVAAPQTFTTTPHYDGYPAVLVRLDSIEPDELAEVLTDSWRLKAPKRLVASFDAAVASGGDARRG